MEQALQTIAHRGGLLQEKRPTYQAAEILNDSEGPPCPEDAFSDFHFAF
ncbi:hypothetical protein [Limnohabitans sp. DM1]|nr:hypothetical protein [Limnohabitans sp. DM1]